MRSSNKRVKKLGFLSLEEEKQIIQSSGFVGRLQNGRDRKGLLIKKGDFDV